MSKRKIAELEGKLKRLKEKRSKLNDELQDWTLKLRAEKYVHRFMPKKIEIFHEETHKKYLELLKTYADLNVRRCIAVFPMETYYEYLQWKTLDLLDGALFNPDTFALINHRHNLHCLLPQKYEIISKEPPTPPPAELSAMMCKMTAARIYQYVRPRKMLLCLCLTVAEYLRCDSPRELAELHLVRFQQVQLKTTSKN